MQASEGETMKRIKSSTGKLVMSAMMAAAICVSTMVVKVPVQATGGYINFGDAAVIICGVIVGGRYGSLSAGTGSALADIFSGYAVYAPATFIIKLLMALTVSLIYGKAKSKKAAAFSCGAVCAELIMIIGYFLYEALFMGYGISALGAMPGNVIQAVSGIVISALLLPVITKAVIKVTH